MMDDTIKDIIYSFIDKTMRFNKAEGQDWDFYGIDNLPYFAVPKNPRHTIEIYGRFIQDAQQYIPIDYMKMKTYIRSWVKKKYL